MKIKMLRSAKGVANPEGSVTMVYEAFRISGHYPGGKAWQSWWEHEALYGAICWVTTMTFASFHKAFNGK